MIPILESRTGRRAGDVVSEPRATIFTIIAHDRARFLQLGYKASDDEKLRELFTGLGHLAGYVKMPAPESKRSTLTRIAAHCIGWVENKLPQVDIFTMVHHERRRQAVLFQDGEIGFDCAKPGVDELLKLRALGEEIGEVAEAIDRLEKAIVGTVSGRRAGKRKVLHNRTLELCAELTQVAAVAVAWLEALAAQASSGGAR